MIPAHDDEGLTLVELLVYISISTLFLGLLAMMFINGIKAQAEATDRDTATGSAGIVSSSIVGSVRNASSFTIVDSGRGLIARVATGANGWQCRAWHVKDGEVRYRASSSALSAADTSTWGELSRGATATLSGGAAFATSGARGLKIGITIATGESTLAVTNGVTAQAVASGAGTACW